MPHCLPTNISPGSLRWANHLPSTCLYSQLSILDGITTCLSIYKPSKSEVATYLPCVSPGSLRWPDYLSTAEIFCDLTEHHKVRHWCHVLVTHMDFRNINTRPIRVNQIIAPRTHACSGVKQLLCVSVCQSVSPQTKCSNIRLSGFSYFHN